METPAGSGSSRWGLWWVKGVRLSARFRSLPTVEFGARFITRRVDGDVMVLDASRQFNHVAAGIAEVDGVDEVVVCNAPDFHPCGFALRLHGEHMVVVHLEGDMQIVVMPVVEVVGTVGHLEERQIAAILHLEEGMQGVHGAAGLSLLDLEDTSEAHAEKILVEPPRFLRVAAAIGVMVQALDTRRHLAGCGPLGVIHRYLLRVGGRQPQPLPCHQNWAGQGFHSVLSSTESK